MILKFFAARFPEKILKGMTPIKTTAKISRYIVRSVAAAVLLLTAQISLAGSATWLSSPQDSTWENPNNWTPGGPPNGPSDIATFGPSSQRDVIISSSVEVNSIVFTSGAASFGLGVSPSVAGAGELIISGTGIIDNSSVLQTLAADNTGQIIFKNTSTAGDARILSAGGDETGQVAPAKSSSMIHRLPKVRSLSRMEDVMETAVVLLLMVHSTGGTARVQVFFGCSNVSGIGYLNISGHQSGMTIGSIEGDGDVFLGANRLRVGTNNLSTTFRGNIQNNEQGSLTKVGSGILTLQPYNEFSDNLNLMLVSGSPIKLDYRSPDVIASLKINGVLQPPGIYGGPMSGAPHIVPEFRGTGSVHVFPSTLANISTRAFVQTGDNVMIGGFIIEGAYSKEVVLRAIGPELSRYHVPNPLANPRLELHDATGALIASNDDWQHTIIGGVIIADQVDYIRDSGYAPSRPTGVGDYRNPATG